MRCWLVLGIVLGGCDAATIEVQGQGLAFLAVQRGSGDFVPVDLRSDGVYELEVDGAFGLAGTCVDPVTGSVTRVMFGRPDDAASWQLRCDEVPTHTVTVTSVDGGVLTAGCGSTYGSGAPVTFEAPEGPCDLVVTDDDSQGANRVWRRNIEVSADTSIEVDLRDGQPMRDVTLAIEGGGNAVYTVGKIVTAHGTSRYFFGDAATAHVPDPAVALPGDIIGYRIVNTTGVVLERDLAPGEILEPNPTQPVELVFPTENIPVTFVEARDGRPAVTFSTTYVGEPRYLAASDGFVQMSASWSAAYEDERARDELVFPDLPALAGWDPTWSLQGVASRQLQLHHDLDDRTFVEINVDL